MGPLAGVKVLELSALGPVPFCGMLLADMGADVVRIDRMGKSDLGTEALQDFDLRGRNKRSAAIDLKRPAGREAVMRLVGKADILLEGFRPGVTERLGVGPDDCFKVRPQLVYGRATGWGQQGPMSKAAGHDINYISLTGALDMIGPQGGAPVPPLNLVGDYGGGALYLAFGVLCALHEAGISGRGQVVDAAMVDGVNSLLTVFHGFQQRGYITPGRGNNELDGGAPYYTTYPTKDGRYMAVGCLEPRFYADFLKGLELDPATLPRQHDRARWPELRAAFARRFLEGSSAEWESRFAGTDACVSPVLTIAEAGSHPQNVARAMMMQVDGVTHPSPAPRFSRTSGDIRSNPPLPGEHTFEVLREWGFPADVIETGLQDGTFMRLKERADA